MNTKKRSTPIQKSVEESILDAVTRFQKDGDSFDPFEGFKKANEPVESKAPVFEREPNETINFREMQAPPNEKVSAPVKSAKLPDKVAENPQGPQNELQSLQLKLLEGDHLRIAQQRIEDLERQLEQLRIENERLASASDLFQKRGEESLRDKHELEKKLSYLEERYNEERTTLKNRLGQSENQSKELKGRVEELESRLTIDVRKSRSRERELENRLELARMEKISLVGSKDEIILDLKRQVDQLNHEIGNYRRKTAEMNQTIEANQEQFRRTVRALRLALTNLEVNEQIGVRSKKAE